MLNHLSIQNFATVEALELEPDRGLNVITGETGAGKSVIMQALGLALGERADAMMVREGSERAEVRACFDLAGNETARAWLAERELDAGDDCILRRTVRADGRSRAWINGTPAPLQQVRELGERLISIHSQHEHQALLSRQAQRDLLDSYAGAADSAREVRRLWRAWQQARREHGEALEAARAGREREELLRFQLEELDELAPEEGELAQLEAEQKRLANAESLIRLCRTSTDALYESSETTTANDLLGQVTGWLGEAGDGDPALNSIRETVESARLQVEAAAEDLRHYLDRLELDPERLSQVEERLSALFSLARKHRVRPEELPERHRQLREEADTLAHYDEHLAALEKAEDQARKDYDKAARALGKLRRNAAPQLAKGVVRHLRELSMEGARMEVSLEECEPGPDGNENLAFLFSANPDQPPRPLARVASGGELSRISLAIQVICARALTVPALVFDEVDVGVSGGIAEIVGRLLRELGEHAQVLCITHQPQVAALGRHHWHVLKEQDRRHTRTDILLLRDEDRINEVARMLGGVEMTDSTLAHAREMVEKAASRPGQGKGYGLRATGCE